MKDKISSFQYFQLGQNNTTKILELFSATKILESINKAQDLNTKIFNQNFYQSQLIESCQNN